MIRKNMLYQRIDNKQAIVIIKLDSEHVYFKHLNNNRESRLAYAIFLELFEPYKRKKPKEKFTDGFTSLGVISLLFGYLILSIMAAANYLGVELDVLIIVWLASCVFYGIWSMTKDE